MKVAVADTSFVVALGNRADVHHQRCVTVHKQIDIIILPQSVLAEVGYMLARELGSAAVASFLRNLPQTRYRPLGLEWPDFARTADLLEQYADTRLDFVDASVAALAERLLINQILTLDRRDFQMLRPRHAPHFELLPA